MNYPDELQVETYWKLTFPIRYDKLKSLEETRSIGNYISEYPALKSSLGYTLLESDFEQLYPDVGMKMYSEWAGFCENIITYAKKRKCDEVHSCHEFPGNHPRFSRSISHHTTFPQSD